MTRSEMIQFCLQVVAENYPETKIKVVEVDAEDVDNGQKLREPINAEIFDASIEIPLLIIERHLLTSKVIEIKNVADHNDSNLSSFTDAKLIVQFDVDKSFFELLQSLKSSCFIICSFKKDPNGIESLPQKFLVIAKVQMEHEIVYLIHHNPVDLSDETPVAIKKQTGKNFQLFSFLNPRSFQEFLD